MIMRFVAHFKAFQLLSGLSHYCEFVYFLAHPYYYLDAQERISMRITFLFVKAFKK